MKVSKVYDDGGLRCRNKGVNLRRILMSSIGHECEWYKLSLWDRLRFAVGKILKKMKKIIERPL